MQAAFRFGTFELDETASELRRNGSQIHLPPQPFQILAILLRNAGEIVDRNRLRQEVWGGTTVDFDRSLNVAIAQIRSALNDNAESPRFIQTVPKKGYRFIAEVSGNAVLLQATPPRKRSTLLTAAAILAVLALAVAATRISRPGTGVVRIAVLPFDTASLPPALAAESDGLFDDLLTRLGGVEPDRLQVIGRRTVLYLNQHGGGSLHDIGKQLNVTYAIESSARPEGATLRIASRLVRTADETVVWSATLSSEDSPERLTGRVTAGVLRTLFPNSVPPSLEPACQNGWEALQTARLLAKNGTIAGLQRSLDYFRKASCAPANAELAEAQIRLARSGVANPAVWQEARSAAESALRSDATLVAAHLALGNVAFWHDWNWDAARREFREALRRNPSDPDAHHDMAWLQVALGQRADARVSIETALTIDPLSARTRMDSAWLLLQTGQFRDAAAAARRTLELDPAMKEAMACLSRAMLYAGDLRGAIDALSPILSKPLAAEIAALPPAEAMRRVVAWPLEQNILHDSYEQAWRLAWLGSSEHAIAALEDAFKSRNMMMPLIAVDPAFRSLREDGRFRKLVVELDLR